MEQPLTVAGIFTFKPNEDDRDGEVPYHSREKLEIMISDYNKSSRRIFQQTRLMSILIIFQKTLKRALKIVKLIS